MFSGVVGKGFTTCLSPTVTHRFASSIAAVSNFPAGSALQPDSPHSANAIAAAITAKSLNSWRAIIIPPR
jgi:hypothetical protein